jgi:hypothetical protein
MLLTSAGLRGFAAGFFIPYAQMPKWWSWFYWLDPLSYMIYGVITRCVTAARKLPAGHECTHELYPSPSMVIIISLACAERIVPCQPVPLA